MAHKVIINSYDDLLDEAVKFRRHLFDQPHSFSIVPHRPSRSVQQNAYLWGWVYKQIAEKLSEAGITILLEDDREHPYTFDVLHAIFKEKFLTPEVITAKNGNQLKIERSTTKLNRIEFNQYLEQIKGFVFMFWKFHVPEPLDGYYQGLARDIS